MGQWQRQGQGAKWGLNSYQLPSCTRSCSNKNQRLPFYLALLANMSCLCRTWSGSLAEKAEAKQVSNHLLNFPIFSSVHCFCSSLSLGNCCVTGRCVSIQSEPSSLGFLLMQSSLLTAIQEDAQWLPSRLSDFPAYSGEGKTLFQCQVLSWWGVPALRWSAYGLGASVTNHHSFITFYLWILSPRALKTPSLTRKGEESRQLL